MSPVCEVKSHCIKPVKFANIPEHLNHLYECTIIGLDTEQCNSVARLLKKYSATFSITDADLGRTGILKHRINTQAAHPIKQPLRRTPEMLDRDVIQPSASQWASGIVMVSKKDGTK